MWRMLKFCLKEGLILMFVLSLDFKNDHFFLFFREKILEVTSTLLKQSIKFIFRTSPNHGV